MSESPAATCRLFGLKGAFSRTETNVSVAAWDKVVLAALTLECAVKEACAALIGAGFGMHV